MNFNGRENLNKNKTRQFLQKIELHTEQHEPPRRYCSRIALIEKSDKAKCAC